MVNISIIILSYNGKDLLSRTLDSVYKFLPHNLAVETIVADNGSTDGSIELIKNTYPWVTLVENGDNLGFSKGNNRGVAVAQGEYILFLNSDTEISSGVIDSIYRHMSSNPTIGIATCKVVLSSGQVDPASHRGFPTPWRALTYFLGLENLAVKLNLPVSLKRILGGYHLVDRDLETSHEIDSCTGAFLMIRRTTGDAVGWWSEEYFMYGEDLDFCYKVKLLGLKVMYFPDCSILHLKHASGLKKKSSVMSSDELNNVRTIKQRTTRAFYDAMIIFYEKFYKTRYPSFVRLFVYFFIRFKERIALSRIR